MAKRRGREYWLAAVMRFEGSDLSQSAYCLRYKLNIGTFRAWLYRLRSEGASVKRKRSNSPKAKFLEVGMRAPEKANATQCTLRVGQIEVEFRESPSTEYLSDVACRLRSASL